MQVQTQEKAKVRVKLKEPTEKVELIFLEVAETVRTQRQTSFRIGELLYRLYGLGFTDQAISDRLKKMGVPFERGTVNTYRQVYQFFAITHGLMLLAQDRPISTLMAIRRVAQTYQLPTEKIREILEATKGMTHEETLLWLKERYDFGTTEQRFASIRVPLEVKPIFDEAVQKLSSVAETAGDSELSPAQVIEFFSKLILDSDPDALLDLYRREMGDGA